MRGHVTRKFCYINQSGSINWPKLGPLDFQLPPSATNTHQHNQQLSQEILLNHAEPGEFRGVEIGRGSRNGGAVQHAEDAAALLPRRIVQPCAMVRSNVSRFLVVRFMRNTHSQFGPWW